MRTTATIFLAFIIAAFLTRPASAQTTYLLQDGEFSSSFVLDTNNDGTLDTEGAPASWSSSAGILYGRDYNPDGLVEGLVKLIDNRRANGYWTLVYASVTSRDVGVRIENTSTGDYWDFVTTLVPGRGLYWGAFPNGYLSFLMIGPGTTVSLQQAFTPAGFIPSFYYRSRVNGSGAKQSRELDPQLEDQLVLELDREIKDRLVAKYEEALADRRSFAVQGHR